VLERIDNEPAAARTGETTGAQEALAGVQVAQPAMPMVIEEVDPLAGLYTGLVGGAAVLALLVAGTMLAAAGEATPGFVSVLGGNLLIAWVVCLVVLGIGAALGWFLNKPSAARQ